MYWSKAATNSSWPDNWNGSTPTVGDLIGNQTIPSLSYGEETILTFNWSVLDPTIHNNWNSCLLARIVNTPHDSITVHPNDLSSDIYYNNNVSLRNTVVINTGDGLPPIIDGMRYPYGTYMYIGNPSEYTEINNLVFYCPDTEVGNPITKEAEVSIKFDEQGWNVISSQIENRDDIKIVTDRTIILLESSTEFKNLVFPPNLRSQIYVGFSFLADELTDKNDFRFHIQQSNANSEPGIWQGGVHFLVKKESRTPFDANAGNDKEICVGETVTVNAEQLPESVSYKWYDKEGNFICSGKDLSVQPEKTKKYKLEVTAEADGFKDYDEIEVFVKEFFISSLTPNPASNIVNVEYSALNATSASLKITNSTAPSISENFVLNCLINQSSIDISSLPAGAYTVTLICDGIVTDSKSLVIQ